MRRPKQVPLLPMSLLISIVMLLVGSPVSPRYAPPESSIGYAFAQDLVHSNMFMKPLGVLDVWL